MRIYFTATPLITEGEARAKAKAKGLLLRQALNHWTSLRYFDAKETRGDAKPDALIDRRLSSLLLQVTENGCFGSITT